MQSQTCLNSAERAGLRPKGNVPTLRFPEFKGNWTESTIGKEFELYSGNTPSRLDKENFVGDVNWITSGELKEHYIGDTKEKISESSAKENNLRLMPEGTFVIAIYGLEAEGVRSTGSIITKRSTISQACMAFTPKGDISNEFMYSWYKKHGNVIGIRYAQGTKQQNLSYDIIEKFKIRYPSLKEQDKLNSFISLLDTRIATQIRIIEDLKSERKFLLEQLFCLPKEHSPKLRLKGMTGDWNKVRLYDIVERITERNKANTCSRVLTIAAQYGLIDQQEFFNKQIASSDLTTYYLLHKGDFAYNKSYSGDYPWGAVKRLDNYNEGVLSSLYVCFRPNGNVDSDFLCHYFESTKWYRGISEISGEGARNHGLLNMSVDNYFNTIHRIPSVEEQRQISSVLNTTTQKIEIEVSILDRLQQQKKYLLSTMFI